MHSSRIYKYIQSKLWSLVVEEKSQTTEISNWKGDASILIVSEAPNCQSITLMDGLFTGYMLV